MADSLIVKLGADTSAFATQLANAGKDVAKWGAQSGANVGTEFGRAFGRKLGVSDVARSALVALGIDAKEIADRVARAWTNMSKEEEAAYKTIGTLSGQVADAEIAASRKRMSAQEQYKLALLDEQRLRTAIAENQAKTAQDQLRLLEDRQKLLAIEEQLNRQLVASEEERFKYVNAQYETDKLVRDAKERGDRMEKDRLKKLQEEGEEIYKKQFRLEQELKALKLAGLQPEERLVALQSEQYALQQKITKAKITGGETTEDEIKALHLKKDIEQTILEIIEKQTASKKEQVEAMNAAGDMGVLRTSSGFQTYNTSQEQAQYEKGLVNQARAEIQYEINELTAKLENYQRSGSSLGQFEIPGLMARIEALKGRAQNVNDFVFNPNYSDAAGKGIFATQVSAIGDPLKLQEKQTNVLQDVAGGVAELNTRLRTAGFGTNG